MMFRGPFDDTEWTTGTYGVGSPPDAGVVHVFDPVTLQPLGTVPLGGSPGRLARGEGDVMWVAGFYGGLRRYDAYTRIVLPDPADPALLADGLSAVAWDPAAGSASQPRRRSLCSRIRVTSLS